MHGIVAVVADQRVTSRAQDGGPLQIGSFAQVPGVEVISTGSTQLDRYCAGIDRDPASITRSIVCQSPTTTPAPTRDKVEHASDAGFRHLSWHCPRPYPTGAGRWIADEIISASV